MCIQKPVSSLHVGYDYQIPGHGITISSFKNKQTKKLVQNLTQYLLLAF